MQAPKNGFFYVLDAATGEFINGNNYVPMNWATGLTEDGRPIEVPEARYAEIPYLQTPGPLGGHNWHPMAFNPDVGLAYIPAQEIPQAYGTDPRFQDDSSKWNTGADFAAGVPQLIPSEVFKFLRSGLKGRLIAWDPVANEARWTVEHERTSAFIEDRCSDAAVRIRLCVVHDARRPRRPDRHPVSRHS